MAKAKVFNGADQIFEYAHLFQGKRIGLVTNPSGVLKDLTATVDVFHRHFNLVALYSPEHGVRGNVQAGDKVEHYVDDQTGVMVYSIYGEHRHPKDEMLYDIDIMVYDIQDIGSRYYTYIYSMANCMTACARLGIPFVVLDRINIIGAVEPQGNILDTRFKSFVGQYPIPQRYSLTCGELAQLMNREYNIGVDLTVIPVKGWTRDMMLSDTDLTFINPSPNLASLDAAILYNGTCLIEGTNLSEGRGTTRPFEYIGAPWLDAYKFAKELNELEIDGVIFRPVYFTPVFHKHKDLLCGGVQIHTTDRKQVRPVELGIHILFKAKEMSGDKFEFIPPQSENGEYFIDLLMGSDILRDPKACKNQIFELIKKDQQAFWEIWNRYRIYK
jgi:uncharacterized protein YbbC (DUF1343 family)